MRNMGSMMMGAGMMPGMPGGGGNPFMSGGGQGGTTQSSSTQTVDTGPWSAQQPWLRRPSVTSDRPWMDASPRSG